MVLYKDLNERWINTIKDWYGYVSYEVIMTSIYHILYGEAPLTYYVTYNPKDKSYGLVNEFFNDGPYFTTTCIAENEDNEDDSIAKNAIPRSMACISGKKQGVYTSALDFINFIENETIGKPFSIREKIKMYPLKNDIAVFVTLMSDTFEDDDKDYVGRITLCGLNKKTIFDYFNKVLMPKIIECTKVIENKELPKYQLAYFDGRGIRTTYLTLKTNVGNVEDNYNNDLPYSNINELINSKKSELILFYGEPGTGKTSLIKHLIKDNKDRPFIFIDGSLFSSISDGTFLSFITDNKNAVLIFEDCEKILMKRDETYNQNIGTLLNLTDGLMADEYTLKFIMTFNCSMDKIDEAIRRKGRLSLEYKFDKLKADKAHKINENANNDMTLADLYNLEKEVSIGAKKRVKIGFKNESN